MGLVATKPGLIIAEEDRAVSEDTVRHLHEQMKVFGKTYLELGSGSGMHLLELAARNPDVLCIGVEIRYKRAFRTGEKAERDGLKNVLVVRSDARLIPSLFPKGSLDGVLVNYPDPWEKRRWRKNRLLNADFLKVIWELLTPTGFFRYKTDHHEYFDSTCKLLSPEAWRETKRTKDLLASEWFVDNVPTEFEMLFRSQQLPLCMIEIAKVSV